MHSNSSIKIDQSVSQNSGKILSLIFPCTLFLLTLSISALKSTFPPSFPLFVALGLTATFFLRSFGLLCAYLLLAPFFFFAYKEKQLWEMTLVYTLAIDYFIALLFFDKEETKSESSNSQIEELQKIIDQLKEEAERRYLEKTEIEAKYWELQKAINQDSSSQILSEEAKYKQLRQQFDEKSKILSETRKTLFETEGKLLALQKERTLDDDDRRKKEEELAKALEKEIETNQQYEKEISYLEQLVADLIKK